LKPAPDLELLSRKADMKTLVFWVVITGSALAWAADPPCGVLLRNAVSSDLELAVGFEASRTPSQRHASERLLLDMRDCPAQFVESMTQAVSGGQFKEEETVAKFAGLWVDDLKWAMESSWPAPGLGAEIAQVAGITPPESDVWQTFADPLRSLVKAGNQAAPADSCGPFVEHTLNDLSEEYRDSSGDLGAGLMAHLIYRLTSCPKLVLDTMRRNPDLLHELTGAGHDSPFWGDIDGLPEMREIKKRLVLAVREFHPAPGDAKLHGQLLKGLETVCIEVIDYKPLTPPCPLNDNRDYVPVSDAGTVPFPADQFDRLEQVAKPAPAPATPQPATH
jgi:hypothetical protein